VSGFSYVLFWCVAFNVVVSCCVDFNVQPLQQDDDGQCISVAIPPDMVQKWYHHGTHGGEFRTFFDDFAEKHPPVAATTTPKANNKRAAALATPEQPSAKKAKIDAKYIFDVEPDGAILGKARFVNVLNLLSMVLCCCYCCRCCC
jgi:hypothetical protein